MFYYANGVERVQVHLGYVQRCGVSQTTALLVDGSLGGFHTAVFFLPPPSLGHFFILSSDGIDVEKSRGNWIR